MRKEGIGWGKTITKNEDQSRRGVEGFGVLVKNTFFLFAK
jgi:hypothetical protein